MMSKRVKYALAHLTRKRHTALLARPNWRRLERIDINCQGNAFGVHKAALKCHASKRIKAMAQPRAVTKKYDPTKSPPAYTRIHPKTLNAKTSKRIQDLALPKKRNLLVLKRQAVGNKSLTTYINRVLTRIRKSRYNKYKVLCHAAEQQIVARQAKLRKKLHKALAKPEDWARHQQFLDRCAGPKPTHEPEEPDRGEKRSVEDMPRLEELAAPVAKDVPEYVDPFRVPESALTYQITDRVKELAVRKNPHEPIPPLIPGTVSRAACKAVASPRTLILAKPAVRPAGLETDLKEDAFGVPKRALTAKCTARTKRLAKPKTYGKAR